MLRIHPVIIGHSAGVGARKPTNLCLPYREPLSREWLTWFLVAHAVPGLEEHVGGVFRRVLRLPHRPGIVAIELCDGYVRTDLTLADPRDRAAAAASVRRLLDLDADPLTVDAALSRDPALAPAVAATPGIRVPGSVDGAEMLIRTMIGQQISVPAAATHTAALVAALGEPVGDLRAFPTPAAIAEHGADVLRGPRRRVAAIVGAAEAIADGSLDLHAGATERTYAATCSLYPASARGPRTTSPCGCWPIPTRCSTPTSSCGPGPELLGCDLAATQNWAPWRSYATVHLWHTAIMARRGIRPQPASNPSANNERVGP